jgi:hypothetical protein
MSPAQPIDLLPKHADDCFARYPKDSSSKSSASVADACCTSPTLNRRNRKKSDGALVAVVDAPLAVVEEGVFQRLVNSLVEIGRQHKDH